MKRGTKHIWISCETWVEHMNCNICAFKYIIIIITNGWICRLFSLFLRWRSAACFFLHRAPSSINSQREREHTFLKNIWTRAPHISSISDVQQQSMRAWFNELWIYFNGRITLRWMNAICYCFIYRQSLTGSKSWWLRVCVWMYVFAYINVACCILFGYVDGVCIGRRVVLLYVLTKCSFFSLFI